MSENLRSPNIYHPKTVSELLWIKSKYPDTMLWAGGTYIMSRTGFYPNPSQKDIIRLDGITELHKIQHSDRYLEAGSMVTIQHLLSNGSGILSKPVKTALSEIGNSTVKSIATIGGSLAAPSFRSSICCILATIGAMVELRFFNRKNNSKWVNVSKLYDISGTFLYEKKAIITKVRIPSAESQFAQFFTTIDSPLRKEETSVSCGLQYTVSQGNISQPSVCISFPSAGFITSAEIENKINTINLPVNPQMIQSVSQQIVLLVKKICPEASDLQTERVGRLFEKILFSINSRYLVG